MKLLSYLIALILLVEATNNAVDLERLKELIEQVGPDFSANAKCTNLNTSQCCNFLLVDTLSHIEGLPDDESLGDLYVSSYNVRETDAKVFAPTNPFDEGGINVKSITPNTSGGFTFRCRVTYSLKDEHDMIHVDLKDNHAMYCVSPRYPHVETMMRGSSAFPFGLMRLELGECILDESRADQAKVKSSVDGKIHGLVEASLERLSSGKYHGCIDYVASSSHS